MQLVVWFLTAFYNEQRKEKKSWAVLVPPWVIYIHKRVLSCVETAGMSCLAGHEGSSQCKTIKTEARINRQSGAGHVILQMCILVCSCLESSKTQCNLNKVQRCRYDKRQELSWHYEDEFTYHCHKALNRDTDQVLLETSRETLLPTVRAS